MTFEITPPALARVEHLLADKPDNLYFRVEVKAGGCAGFKYRFAIEAADPDQDVLFEDGAVVMDRTSLDLLRGARLEFEEDLSGSRFEVRNPASISSCGCGMSFGV